MNVRIKEIVCILLSMVLLVFPPMSVAAWSDFTDISGHWSETAVREAYYNGLITGYDNNTIKPDQPITKAEVLALLTRALSALSQTDLADTSITSGQWYENSLSQALALKIIQQAESNDLDAAMRREDVFILVARAFQLVKPNQELSVLDQFRDAGDLNYRARASAAALIQRGYILGTGDGLAPAGSITRAEMVAILNRIIGRYMSPEALTSATTGGVSIPLKWSPAVTLSNLSLNTDLLINSCASSITLENVTTNHRILVRSASLDQLSMNGGHIAQFNLAAVTGDVNFSPGKDGSVDVFTIGDGDGQTRLAGSISTVNITGSNRVSYLDMPQLNSLNISGASSTVYVSGDTQIGTINITDTAHGTTLVVDGEVDSLNIAGDSATVRGTGSFSKVFVSGLDSVLEARHDALQKSLDYGLDGVDVVLTPSIETVPAGGNLSVSASFTGVRGPATVSAQWYWNGSPVNGYDNRAFPLAANKTSSFYPTIVYTEDMESSVAIGLELTYVRGGIPQRVYREISVEIENYPYDHYHPGPTTDDKLIALTFDDGPGAHTNRLLDELSARDIQATFFVLGSRTQQYPDVIQRMADDGHEIASHTYSHPNLTGLSRAGIQEQLDRTNSVLESVAGVSPTSLRPPYGSYNQTVLKVCAEKDLPVIYWSVDTLDWKSRDVNAILNRMFNLGSKSVSDGDIVLMHDIHSTTVDAAVIAIDRLIDEGYTFVTVTQLLELRCGGGRAGQVYFHGRK